jgi:hypothetical protein
MTDRWFYSGRCPISGRVEHGEVLRAGSAAEAAALVAEERDLTEVQVSPGIPAGVSGR